MGTHLSITEVMAIFIVIGAVIFFIGNLPSILPVINLVLSIIYLLFVLNIIQFKFDPKIILLGILLIIAGLSAFQFIVSSRKYAGLGAILQFFASITAILVYFKIIDKILN